MTNAQSPRKLRMIGTGLIAFGFLFGGTVRRLGFCLGDSVFSALGLPPWSNGKTGLHYPGVTGMISVLAGTTFINYTIEERSRFLFWRAVLAAIAVLTVLPSFI